MDSKKLVHDLRSVGVKFADGLTEAQLQTIEHYASGCIPNDLRQFLSVAVPVSSSDGEITFPRWDLSLTEPMDMQQKFIEELFLFDVEKNGFWPQSFGERLSGHKAIDYVRSQLSRAPKMIPFIQSQICVSAGYSQSPVWGYHGPLDTIWWSSLEDYICARFDIDKDADSGEKSLIDRVDFWSEVFNESFVC